MRDKEKKREGESWEERGDAGGMQGEKEEGGGRRGRECRGEGEERGRRRCRLNRTALAQRMVACQRRGSSGWRHTHCSGARVVVRWRRAGTVVGRRCGNSGGIMVE